MTVDHRTPEQIQADDELTRAIQKAHDAYFGKQQPFPLTLTDYVVFAAAQGWTPDGFGTTATYTVVRDNAVPPYRVRGLVENQLDHMRASNYRTQAPG